jgi:cardiolipin synthase
VLKAEPEDAVIERALLQGEVAAGRSGDTATILYTQPSGPLKNRHARALREEAAATGVNLVKTGKTPLGK